MKIGILTFHRAHNYGAVLQCYALQEVLKSMGHYVEVIDYRQSYTESVYALVSITMIRKYMFHPRALYKYFSLLGVRKRKKKIFESFIQTYINLSDSCNQNIPKDFDVYIIGSDQLWSIQCLGGTFDKVYMGKFQRNDYCKVIGYAISSNIPSLRILANDDLKECIHNFFKLSMREANLSEFININFNYRADHCIDPTLLTDKELWNSLIISDFNKEEYILVFQIRSPRGTKGHLYNKAKILADKFKCKIIDLTSKNYSVEEFLTLFRNAKYIFTNSFHGTVFSIIFERPFYSVKFNDGLDGRYIALLNQIGLENNCVEFDFVPIGDYVDFSKAKELLKQYREVSYNFLLSI